MERITALCLVAHPDDCVIFARPFIEAHPEFEWSILYLTYTETDPRGKELADYWHKRNINTIHLGFVDTYLDMENCKISFDTEQAAELMLTHASRYDLILTHNEDGDYGHIHHCFVSEVARRLKKPIVYFASYEQHNAEYRVDTAIDIDELPLHREVVLQFMDIDTGRYYISDTAKELLNGKS